MAKKTVGVRMYETTRDRIKVKAAKAKKPMVQFLDETN